MYACKTRISKTSVSLLTLWWREVIVVAWTWPLGSTVEQKLKWWFSLAIFNYQRVHVFWGRGWYWWKFHFQGLIKGLRFQPSTCGGSPHHVVQQDKHGSSNSGNCHELPTPTQWCLSATPTLNGTYWKMMRSSSTKHGFPVSQLSQTGG